MKTFYTEDPKEFLLLAEEFLLEEESMNNLALGLADRLQRENPDQETPFFFVFKDDEGSVLGTALRSASFRPLAISQMGIDVIKVLVNELRTRSILLHGTVGPKATVENFTKAWGTAFSEAMGQGVYECRRLIPPREIKGRVVQANPNNQDELAAAIRFGAGFIADCFPKHREPLVEAEKAMEFYLKGGCIYLWKSLDGEFVSMAANHRDSKNAGTIGWVYTPPEERGKGYGSMVTAAVVEAIFKKGRPLANLYTDLSNPTSNSIYQKIGFVWVGESTHVEYTLE